MALNIRRALQARGMSIPQLAERMGRTHQVVYSVLKNDNPSLNYLIKIANILNCDVIDLFDVPIGIKLIRLPINQDTVKHGSEWALNIKRIIKARDMNISMVADRMGITAKALSSIINGSSTLHRLEQLAGVLDCDVVHFFLPVIIDKTSLEEKQQRKDEKKRLRQNEILERRQNRRKVLLATNPAAQRYERKHKMALNMAAG